MSILQQLIEWDKELLLFLNSMHTPFGDKFMWVYTGKYTWIPLILSLLFVLFRKNWKEALLVCVALAITITCCDQFASTLCKPYFARLRPARDPELSEFVQIVNGYRGGRYGFISSHAANSFGAVVLLSMIFRNKFFAFIIAVIICIVLNGFRSFLLNKKFLNNRESPYIKDPDIRITTGVIYLSVLCIAVYALIATYS